MSEKCNAKFKMHHYDKDIDNCPLCSNLPRSELTTVEEIYRIMGKPCPVVLNTDKKDNTCKKFFDELKSSGARRKLT